MTDSAQDVVRRFCAAWASGDPDELLGFLATDAVIHFVPGGPLTGRDVVRRTFAGMFEMSSNWHLEIRNIASAGGVVFTERSDQFEMGGTRLDVPATGVFEVHGEKISTWRDYVGIDYCDMAKFLSGGASA